MEQWNNTFYYKTYLYILLRTRTYAAAGTLPHVRRWGHTHAIYYVRGRFDLKKNPSWVIYYACAYAGRV